MRVRRDAYGIPHLWAADVLQLAYLQGRTTAEDRAGQLEAERLRSEGRLASRVGAAAVPWDRFARRARLDDTARRCYHALDEPVRQWVSAYVDGVIAVVDGVPWRPWTPLGVFLVQHALFGPFPDKLWRSHATAMLGADRAALFAVEGPGSRSGSNAWAVPGQLAGDPHRLLELPGIYQQVGLACPQFDVVGLAFPGVPGVPHFGHAGRVAWAVTNAMADYQDLYLEDPGDVTDAHRERIDVAGGDPVDVDVAETPRGPLIEPGISLRTPSRVLGSLGFSANLALLHASTLDDVVAALRDWVEPVNSVLVADTTGAVRRVVAGRVPLRDRRPNVPVPATDPAYAWRGWADLPRVDTPPLPAVCANDRRPDVADLGADFAPPHRARRIHALLAEGAAPEEIHIDTLGAAPALRALLTRLAGPLRDRLVAWDGHMTADSADAGAYAAWRAALTRRLLHHPDLEPLRTPAPFDELFTPWTDPVARIGIALDALVTDLDGVEPYAAAALADATAAGAWGERHLLTPVQATIDAPADEPPVPLSGDSGCVLATTSVPGVTDACTRGPVARYVWDLTDRTRSRWIVPFGASGDPASPHFLDQLPAWAAGQLVPAFLEARVTVYEEKVDGFGRFALVTLDPAAHAELVHRWVTQPQNRFWGMAGHTVDDVRDIYTYIDALPTHHAYLIQFDDTPIGLFQTYEPGHDPVGERYEVQPGDIGMHLLLSPRRPPPRGLTDAIAPVLFRFLFRDPTRTRIVVEPDVRNTRALRRLERHGFTQAGDIDLPDKRARLAFLPRHRFPLGSRRTGVT
jgi:penicillin G amidase